MDDFLLLTIFSKFKCYYIKLVIIALLQHWFRGIFLKLNLDYLAYYYFNSQNYEKIVKSKNRPLSPVYSIDKKITNPIMYKVKNSFFSVFPKCICYNINMFILNFGR